MESNTLAARLTQAMKRARISPPRLARECAVSQVAVHKWMTGATKRLRYDTCLRVANVLRVDPDWLNDGTPAKSTPDVIAYHHDVMVLIELKARMQEGMKAIDEILQRTPAPKVAQMTATKKKRSA
jgi:transcriptional regulator with XRE-family HTH domain